MDKVVHFHIPADDMVRAKKFYSSIFGWEIMDTGMDMEYHLVNTVATDEQGMPTEPGGINGAMYKRANPDEYPTIIINVSSIDEYLKKVQFEGGKVLMPKSPVGDFGLYAEISDTEGNRIGMFQDLK